MRSWEDLRGGPRVWHPVLGPRPLCLRPLPASVYRLLERNKEAPPPAPPAKKACRDYSALPLTLASSALKSCRGPKLSFIARVGRGWRGSPRLL